MLFGKVSVYVAISQLQELQSSQILKRRLTEYGFQYFKTCARKHVWMKTKRVGWNQKQGIHNLVLSNRSSVSKTPLNCCLKIHYEFCNGQISREIFSIKRYNYHISCHLFNSQHSAHSPNA